MLFLLIINMPIFALRMCESVYARSGYVPAVKVQCACTHTHRNTHPHMHTHTPSHMSLKLVTRFKRATYSSFSLDTSPALGHNRPSFGHIPPTVRQWQPVLSSDTPHPPTSSIRVKREPPPMPPATAEGSGPACRNNVGDRRCWGSWGLLSCCHRWKRTRCCAVGDGVAAAVGRWW